MLGIMTRWKMEQVVKHGHNNVLAMDSTFCSNKYNVFSLNYHANIIYYGRNSCIITLLYELCLILWVIILIVLGVSFSRSTFYFVQIIHELLVSCGVIERHVLLVCYLNGCLWCYWSKICI